jgi:hypothetical protein
MSPHRPNHRQPRRIRRLALSLRRHRTLTTRLLFLTVLFPVILWLLVSSFAGRTTFGLPDSLLHSPQQKAGAVQNILLVTAHPDDEALFFGPTILQLTRHYPSVKVSLLVMSAGEFPKEGVPSISPFLPLASPKLGKATGLCLRESSFYEELSFSPLKLGALRGHQIKHSYA